jgi:hypothetical protein
MEYGDASVAHASATCAVYGDKTRGWINSLPVVRKRLYNVERSMIGYIFVSSLCLASAVMHAYAYAFSVLFRIPATST